MWQLHRHGNWTSTSGNLAGDLVGPLERRALVGLRRSRDREGFRFLRRSVERERLGCLPRDGSVFAHRVVRGHRHQEHDGTEREQQDGEDRQGPAGSPGSRRGLPGGGRGATGHLPHPSFPPGGGEPDGFRDPFLPGREERAGEPCLFEQTVLGFAVRLEVAVPENVRDFHPLPRESEGDEPRPVAAERVFFGAHERDPVLLRPPDHPVEPFPERFRLPDALVVDAAALVAGEIPGLAAQLSSEKEVPDPRRFEVAGERLPG